ncbi:MAG: hypothetical protein HQL04_07265 [Nitrospirae bacterium]|nr:hypothetical protein [Nitrospirota bacterium]
MKKVALVIIIVMALCVAFTAFAEDKNVRSIKLPDLQTAYKNGPDKEIVEESCNLCHTGADYISMQPKFNKTKWVDILNKMKKVYGAKIKDNEMELISNYLTKTYGTGD